MSRPIPTDGSPHPHTDPPLSSEAADAAVDPTQFTQRARKRAHAWFYRFAIALTAASILATAASALAAALGHRFPGHLLAAVGLSLGLIAIPVSRQTALSKRVLGYALAAALFAALAAGAISFLPDAWFDHPPPHPPGHRISPPPLA